MQLEGNLAQFPIAELIGMTVYSSVTGVLEVGESTPNQIFFRDGQLYHAIAGDIVGVEAVYQTFSLEQVPFRFVAGVVYPQETISQDPLDLIAQATQRAEMWSRVKVHISDFSWVPVLHQSSPAPRVVISEAAWPVLAAVDSQRSIQGIGEFLSQEPLEVGALLIELIEQGLVSVEPPRAKAHAQHAANGEKKSQANGFFNRLMATRYTDDARN